MADLTDEEMNGKPLEQINLTIKQESFVDFTERYFITKLDHNKKGFLWDLVNSKSIKVSKDLKADAVTFSFEDSYIGQKVEVEVGFIVEYYDDYSWELIKVDFNVVAINKI
jgi:hypothetical protein